MDPNLWASEEAGTPFFHVSTGENAGADEFLPLLSFVLAQCDLPDLLLEAEYMSELLEPTLLTGEGKSSLTSCLGETGFLAGSRAFVSTEGKAGPLPQPEQHSMYPVSQAATT